MLAYDLSDKHDMRDPLHRSPEVVQWAREELPLPDDGETKDAIDAFLAATRRRPRQRSFKAA